MIFCATFEEIKGHYIKMILLVPVRGRAFMLRGMSPAMGAVRGVCAPAKERRKELECRLPAQLPLRLFCSQMGVFCCVCFAPKWMLGAW